MNNLTEMLILVHIENMMQMQMQIGKESIWNVFEKCKEIRVYHSSPVKEVTAVHQFKETPGTFIKVHWWVQVIFESQRVISLKFFKVH